MLKLFVEKFKNLIEDLEYEWFTYTHLMKFVRLNKKSAGK